MSRARRRMLPAIAALAAATAIAPALASAATPRPAVVTVVQGKTSHFSMTSNKKVVRRGRVTFAVRNSGSMGHELVVIRTPRAANRLPVSGGRASERGRVGEIPFIAPRQTKRITLRLARGHYVLICNFGGHYQGGMRLNLVVR